MTAFDPKRTLGSAYGWMAIPPERPTVNYLPALEDRVCHPIVAGKEASDGTFALFKAITVYSCLAPREAELSTYLI